MCLMTQSPYPSCVYPLAVHGDMLYASVALVFASMALMFLAGLICGYISGTRQS